MEARAEKAEDAFLNEWSSKSLDDDVASALAETEETQFRGAMDMLDKLLAASSVYHERMSAINDGVIQAQQPTAFVGTLRNYQLDGFRWLVARFLFGEGAILVCFKVRCTAKIRAITMFAQADEMGLGKTIQIIALLAWCKYHVVQGTAASRRGHYLNSHALTSPLQCTTKILVMDKVQGKRSPLLSLHRLLQSKIGAERYRGLLRNFPWLSTMGASSTERSCRLNCEAAPTKTERCW